MAIHHPSSVKDPVSFTAAEIFEEYLPQVLKIQKEMAAQIDAVLNFKLSGDGGGEWTVNLGDQTVSTGLHAHPDFGLTTSSENFKKIIEGKLDASQAIEQKLVEIEGRPQLLASLAALLRPAD